jgi:hypothetical protein
MADANVHAQRLYQLGMQHGAMYCAASAIRATKGRGPLPHMAVFTFDDHRGGPWEWFQEAEAADDVRNGERAAWLKSSSSNHGSELDEVVFEYNACKKAGKLRWEKYDNDTQQVLRDMASSSKKFDILVERTVELGDPDRKTGEKWKYCLTLWNPSWWTADGEVGEQEGSGGTKRRIRVTSKASLDAL